MPCTILEIGCGKGRDASWLSEQGHAVIGIDHSPSAIARAWRESASLPEKPKLLTVDFMRFSPVRPFDVVYDRGFFHNQEGDRERTAAAERIARLLGPSGLWINISGSADEYEKGLVHGKVFLSDIARTVEPYFEILLVKKAPYGEIEGGHDFPAWYSVFRRR